MIDFDPSSFHARKYTFESLSKVKFMLLGDRTANSIQNSDCVYEFEDVSKIQFIVPYRVNTRHIAVYVQFDGSETFLCFKRFNIKPTIKRDTIQNQVNYLMKVLQVYKFPIVDPQLFFEQIQLQIVD